MDYSWRLFQRSWTFVLSPFGLDRFFTFLKGRKLTFGFWVKYSTDRVILPPSGGSYERQLVYEPLEHRDSIRLLVLFKGKPMDPIRGELIQGRINDHPEFSALSYCWGDTLISSTIHLEQGGVQVTENGLLALQQLRSTDKNTIHWIDQICINQIDLQEKINQIRHMQETYRQAEMVNIWLGPSTSNSALGIELFRDFATHDLKSHSKSVWQLHSPNQVIVAIEDILSRSWFERIWVVQEVVAANKTTMLCGQYHFSWIPSDISQLRRFQRGIKFAEISPEWEQLGLKVIDMRLFLDLLALQLKEQRKKARIEYRVPSDLLDVMHELRYKKSSDRRDMIFALMGLADTEIMPDYGRTVEESFQSLKEPMDLSDDTRNRSLLT
ncbi:hypothetical protein HYALB_00005246 [Hymenoscyphus albidus]|uniref:Heterokaryon incompatibility domain-containing protein n=1 Tax=Hymenoscyphus albidus TaxID=595503 RepID=A0A9N9LUY6_9HELO|nr:hypothetical protein HYALB_00005246 [Hymenoscyphus albidus]